MSLTAKIRNSKYTDLDLHLVVNSEEIDVVRGITLLGVEVTEYGTQYVSGMHDTLGRFEIQGGAAFGGTRSDWWVEFPESDQYGTIPCTTRVEAIKLVNNL